MEAYHPKCPIRTPPPCSCEGCLPWLLDCAISSNTLSLKVSYLDGIVSFRPFAIFRFNLCKCAAVCLATRFDFKYVLPSFKCALLFLSIHLSTGILQNGLVVKISSTRILGCYNIEKKLEYFSCFSSVFQGVKVIAAPCFAMQFGFGLTCSPFPRTHDRLILPFNCRFSTTR